MVNPAAVRARQRATLEALDKVAQLLVVGEPYETSDPALAATLGVHHDRIRDVRVELEEVGGLTVKKVTYLRDEGGRKRAGWKSEWTLLVSADEGRRRLEAKYEADAIATSTQLSKAMKAAQQNRSARIKAERAAAAAGKVNGSGIAAIRPAERSELVHVAGPEPVQRLAVLAPERKDEPHALITAARQYASLRQQVEEKVAELERLGVTINHEALAKAVKLPNDPILQAVADTLPYIDGLERQVERLTRTNGELREKVAGLPAIMNENSRLKEQVSRLVSRKAEENGHGVSAASAAAHG